MNIVRDTNKLQGVTHPSDLYHSQIRRDVNTRIVSIENGREPVGIAITLSYNGTVPPIAYTLAPGEIKHVSINCMSGETQFLHLLSPKTGKPLGNSSPLRREANAFVIRQGLNTYWVQGFYHRS